MFARVLSLWLCSASLGSAASSSGFARGEFQPLTQFRQQHRRTVDGRLCAAAFVQNRETYTGQLLALKVCMRFSPNIFSFCKGCTDAPSPKGDSGRPWCYVEAQLAPSGGTWNYCAPVVDYDALRREGASALGAKVGDVRGFVSKLGKAQKAGEIALDMCVFIFRRKRFGFGFSCIGIRYKKQCSVQARA